MAKKFSADPQTYREKYGWSVFNKVLVVMLIVLPYVFCAYLAYRTEVRNADYRDLFGLYEVLIQDCEESTDCETTVPDPKTVEKVQGEQGLPGIPGVAGDRGPRGRAPTTAEIAQAVDAYCATEGCSGEDGKSPSAEEIAAAISAYCAGGACRGTDGADGQNGANGADGADGQSVQGPAGPPGSDGAKGADGADGKSAFPFTFDIVVAGVPYTCTVTSSTESKCVVSGTSESVPTVPPTDPAT